jgi:hypothetical protein
MLFPAEALLHCWRYYYKPDFLLSEADNLTFPLVRDCFIRF